MASDNSKGGLSIFLEFSTSYRRYVKIDSNYCAWYGEEYDSHSNGDLAGGCYQLHVTKDRRASFLDFIEKVLQILSK